jgi:hypothetical protein
MVYTVNALAVASLAPSMSKKVNGKQTLGLNPRPLHLSRVIHPGTTTHATSIDYYCTPSKEVL